MYTYISTKI